jgi:TolB-like protein/Flp pilus assembly protein TadD/predicted Ser/Thr protein kinase
MPAMPLAAGQSLSFYEILGPLGAGGMGEVYRARDTRLNREVAIKVLPEELAHDEERLLRFEREARALASLNHPNVAQVFGIDSVDDTRFIAMEFVPGENLSVRLSRGAPPLAETLDLCRQIAEGVEAAHEAGVIHRDLKPANVVITPEGKVKVLDFGLAKPTNANDGESSAIDSGLRTEEGRLIGTPTYMAPEQARGKSIDKRVDVWAFGCVLYECLTGASAFRGETSTDLLVAILHEEPDWKALPAATPARVRELLKRTLIKDPRARLRDIGDARIALETAARASGLPRWAGTAAGALVLLLLVIWVAGRLAEWTGTSGSPGPGATAGGPLSPGTDESTSIAILPFQNLSGDPATDPFVNGLHEDLIIRLSNIDGLTVISKASASRFADSSLSGRELAERLGVSTVLQAGVQRSGSTVRLTAQLIDGGTDRNLWADGYVEDIAVEDVFEVQARLVERIAEQLARELTVEQRAAIQEPPTTDPQAFELYVRGRDSWVGLSGPTLRRSLDYFSDAIARDPSFARAHSGIADTYLAMEFVGVLPLEEAIALARRSVEEALSIDPDLAEARSALGHVFLHEMNGPEGERELRRAVDLNPSFLDAHMFLGTALLDWGRLDQAEESTLAALKLDPLSTYGAWGAGLVRLARDDYSGAAEHFQRAVDLDGLWVGHYELAWALSALGEHERASAEIERALQKSTGALALEFGLESTAAAFQAMSGDSAGARARLEVLNAQTESPFALGLAHAVLGDVDLAFELWLNQTDWTIMLPIHFRYGPMLDGIRDDPRYPDVLDRIDEQWGW